MCAKPCFFLSAGFVWAKAPCTMRRRTVPEFNAGIAVIQRKFSHVFFDSNLSFFPGVTFFTRQAEGTRVPSESIHRVCREWSVRIAHTSKHSEGRLVFPESRRNHSFSSQNRAWLFRLRRSDIKKLGRLTIVRLSPLDISECRKLFLLYEKNDFVRVRKSHSLLWYSARPKLKRALHSMHNSSQHHV